jgi:hypothetical protein
MAKSLAELHDGILRHRDDTTSIASMKPTALLQWTAHFQLLDKCGRIHLQAFTLACGLALAAGVAMMVDASQHESAPSIQAVWSQVPDAARASPLGDPARTVFFIVSSQLQADSLRWQFDTDNHGTPCGTGPQVRILVADNPENERQSRTTIDEASTPGAFVQVVDMRQR